MGQLRLSSRIGQRAILTSRWGKDHRMPWETGVPETPWTRAKCPRPLSAKRQQARPPRRRRPSTRPPPQAYQQMLAIRRMEEAFARPTRRGNRGFLHLGIVQEVVCVGLHRHTPAGGLRGRDLPRDGQRLCQWTSARAILAELYGKKTGISKASRSMHSSTRPTTSSRLRYRRGARADRGGDGFKAIPRREAVTLCYSVSATNIGGFFEGMALASPLEATVVSSREQHVAMGPRSTGRSPSRTCR